MGTRKYIVCVDFDGVLHSYVRPWQGATVISDPPVSGALRWLVEMTADDRFSIAIYSSRSKEPGGIEAMESWLRYHYQAAGWPHDEVRYILQQIEFPTQKPAASMTIDDRAFVFEGRFPSPEEMLAFKPWNKREDKYYGKLTADRETEIRRAHNETPYEDRDSSDHVIGELLDEIDLIRGAKRAHPLNTLRVYDHGGSVNVVLNGRQINALAVGTIITYEDVLRWAEIPYREDVKVSWSLGSERGTLVHGCGVVAEEGMVIHATNSTPGVRGV